MEDMKVQKSDYETGGRGLKWKQEQRRQRNICRRGTLGTGGSQRAGESGAVQWKVKNEESTGHM